LVVNARDAIESGGRITVESSHVELGEPGGERRSCVMLAVRDTGVGMDEATRARIFEPFFTTKERGRGTGLGLSTVFGIVRHSHGHLWVDSEPGRGTTFRVYLPRVTAAAPRRRDESRPMTLRGSETVLVVEDDDQVRAVAVAILRRRGYRIIAARDGDEAQRASEAAPGALDLLVTDVVLPGISGPELAQRLRRRHPALKVLCMSGYTDEINDGDAVRETHLPYLQKPFTADALSIAVRRVLDGDLDPRAA
jgi:two-component system cell cycle sensor histidine kinase/response regulator CckA